MGPPRPGSGRTKIVLVVSSLLSLLLAEVLLRTFAPRRTIEVLSRLYPAMFEASDALPYRLRRNYQGRLARPEFDTTIRINAQGYRGEETAPATADSLRILVIGDSFTFGWGVEGHQTYASQLQQRLSKRAPARSIAVINAGFAAGYSPDTYYVYLKREGLALGPDVIVVGLFVGNDLDSDAAFENEWLEQDAAGLPLRIRNGNVQVVGNQLLPRDLPFRYRAPLVHRLHVFQGLVDVWWELKPRLVSRLPHVATPVHAAAQATADAVPYIYRTTYAERTERVLNRVQSLAIGMQRLAAEAGVPLYFMLIPAPEQMGDDPFVGLPAEIGKPQRLLRAFFEQEGIAYLDLLLWLKERAAGRPLYFPMDGHWNALGHALAAERLATFLEQPPANATSR